MGVFTIDFRGNGESDGYTTTFSFHEIDDVKAAYDFITASGEKKIVLYGESMGAATVLRATALYKLDLYGIISDGAFGSLKEGVEGRIRTMGLPGEPVANLICFWGSVEEWYWIFGIKPTEYAKQITCPILIEWGSIDERVKRSEAELIYKNLASVNKKFIEYKGCGHESFYAKLPQEWMKNVSAFLTGLCQAPYLSFLAKAS